MNFSVDMVRLETRAESADFMEFINRYFSENPYVMHYMKSAIREYRHNFKINETYLLDIPKEFGERKTGCNNFYLAYQHNSESLHKLKFKLIIEYNPNKCDVNEGLLHKILKRHYYNPAAVDVKGCDVCCDLHGISMNDFVYDKCRKRTEMDYRTVKGRTVYIGDRGSNGRVKVYDKAAEQGLSDEDWTRWEVTLKLDSSIAQMLAGMMELDVNLPKVYFGFCGLDDVEMDANMRCALYGISQGIVKLNDFGRRYQKKIAPYVGNTTQVQINNSNIIDLNNTIISYFREFVKNLFPEKYHETEKKVEKMNERLAKILNKPEQMEIEEN